MSWLRIDDGFPDHPKVAGLSDREFRVLVSTMAWCARFKTSGKVPVSAWRRLDVNDRLVDRFVELGLFDLVDHEVFVHDFSEYNSTLEDRVRTALEEMPDASANELCKAVGGNRKLVLSAIRRFRSGSESGSGTGSTSGSIGGSGTGSESVSRAEPQPQPLLVNSSTQSSEDRPATNGTHAPAAAEDETERAAAATAAVGWSQPQQSRARRDPARALAWVARSGHSDVDNPGAFSWWGFNQGGWPDTPRPARDVHEVARDLIDNGAWQYEPDDLLVELDNLQRRLGQTLTDTQRQLLVQHAADLEHRSWQAGTETAA